LTAKQPRIFLCHASEDKPRVRELYRQLKAAGYYPWLDEEDLLPGQNWRAEIKRILGDPYNLVVVCLSGHSVTKRGTVQREIKWALDVLEEMPEDTIYLIPARLEACPAPDKLSDLHWVDLFAAGGFERLKRALDFEIGRRAAVLRPEPVKPAPDAETEAPHPAPEPAPALPARQPFEPELILIPAGEFLMGSTREQVEQLIAQGANRKWVEGELPQHSVDLPDYYIAKTLVTNVQYAVFAEATGRGKPVEGKEDHPVVNVTWHDAMAYCAWLAKRTGKVYRLPSEAEWEKAARGTDGRIWPWGDEPPHKERCNFENNVRGTTPAGRYSPDGDSPYGCVDMAGNVWEWTLSLWGKDREKPDFKYPYDSEDGREDVKAGDDNLRVLRGGAFNAKECVVRCAARDRLNPNTHGRNGGFRVCVAAQQE
jgi:formylglycine-generating enzyme required for sulfatase activity